MHQKNLLKQSGLPIFLKNNGIVFGAGMTTPEFEAKSYRENKKFFINRGLDKNKKLYYIYRNSCLQEDLAVFRKNGLRYDITVLSPGSIGNEPVRTVGHLHKFFLGAERPAEIYQVLSGKAIFLLHNTKEGTLYAIPGKTGEKILIPGYCAHITINQSSKEPLAVANIFSDKKNSSDYSFFGKTRGPAWYPVRKKEKIIFIKNPNKNSQEIPLFYIKHPLLPKGISKSKTLYKEFIGNPKIFSSLLRPKK